MIIDLACSEVISYAASYNRRPIVYELGIKPSGTQTYADLDITLTLSSLGQEMVQPWRRRVASLGPGGIVWGASDFVGLQPDVNGLLQQRELKWGTFTVTVEKAGEILAETTRDVTILAASSWVGGEPLSMYAPTLASFVQPHEKALAPVLKRATAYLTSHGADPSLEGYQSNDPARVDQIVEGLYEAVRAREIGYINPPAGWDLQSNSETAGQRVRLPGEVLGDGLGTCLDTTVLMASLIEVAGLRPVLVIVPGHAFVGYWRYESRRGDDGPEARFSTPAVSARDALTFIESGLLQVVETTTLCAGHITQPFAKAVTRAHSTLDDHEVAKLDPITGEVTVTSLLWGANATDACVVDVAGTRRRGYARPLPIRHVEEDGSVTVVEYTAPEFNIELLRDAVKDAGGGTASGLISRNLPPRVKRWQDSLLDLTLRNRLLKYPTIDKNRSGIALYIPATALGTVEDLLQSDQTVKLLPYPTTDGRRPINLSLRRTTPPEHDADLTRRLVTERAIHTNISPDSYSTALRRMQTNARSIIDESGTNGLYLAIGMVSWRPKHRDDEANAPLILVPVNLKASNRNREFALEIDSASAVTPNFSLAEKLRQDFQLDLPKLVEPETDDAGIDVDGLITYVRDEFLKAGLHEFRVDAAATLGFFDFSTYRLWRDLQENWPRFIENSPLVKHLVESPTQEFNDPKAEVAHTASLNEFAATLPILADGSQAGAVLDAMEGKTFVLQGPPGSGKSQTITNLLARALHAGMRVLFVAEKPGALSVVRDRLEGVGLGTFGLNLHDKGMRPADVRRQLNEALDAAAVTDRIGFEAAQRDIDRAMSPLQKFPERLHAVGRLGESAYSARDKLLAIPVESALPVPATFVNTVSLEDLDDIRRRFRDAREVATNAGPARTNPWSFARVGAADITLELRNKLAQLTVQVGEACSRVAAQPAAGEYLAGVETLNELVATGPLAEREIDLGTVDASSTAAATQARKHVLDTIDGYAVEQLFAGAAPESLAAPIAELRSLADAALASFIIGRKKRVLAACVRTQEYLAPGTGITKENLVSTLGDVEKLQASTRDYLAYLTAIPGLLLAPSTNLLATPDRTAIATQVLRLEADTQLVSNDGSPARTRVRSLINSGSNTAQSVGALGRAIGELFAVLGTSAESATLWLAGRSVAEVVQRSSTLWRQDAQERDLLQLRRWAALRDLVGPIEDKGLADAAAQVASGTVEPQDADMAFERGFLSAVLRKQLDDEALDAFDGTQHDGYVRGYTAAAEELRRLSPGVLASDMIEHRTFQAGAAVGAVGELRRELGKRRGFKPIRRLLTEHSSVINQITPLVLAVPDALVRFIDGDLEPFDLVVFDEASQIRVAHAIGALGRGQAAIVVGDSKQMPPTSVAQIGTTALDDELDDDPEAPMQDEESILTECIRAAVPETYLSWHYRSEDETLIAFSNKNYYDGRLRTLPAPNTSTEAKGLSFVKIDGQFIRQSKNTVGAGRGTNKAEADAIVAEIVRRVHDGAQSKHSIGVVTLNQPQQKLVQELLSASDDDAVMRALDPDETAEPIKVWNLETVQGHERDVILFSVAFSKDESGKLSRNFGPLIYSGGERRLNVAVTRARRQVIVFCSFDPEELRADGMSDGLQQLAEYLRIAKYGPTASGATGSAPIAPPDRHREEVAKALRERGLRVATEVGLSGFKVDIAVAKETPQGSWSVAVLTDGREWKSRPTVGDRDSLPLSLLGDRMGWGAVTRVWSPDWLRDANGVVDRIEELVREVESGERPAKLQAAQTNPTTSVLSSAPRATIPPRALAAPAPTTPSFPDVPEWTAWSPKSYGPAFALEQLFDQKTREYLRSIVVEIIQVEGPVHTDRAARHLGWMHGLERVHGTRVAAIRDVLSPAFTISQDGFLFLNQDGPDGYTGWAKSETSERKAEEISLVEISNAMTDVARIGLGASREELVTSAATAFGFRRVTTGIRARMERGVDEAVRRGALREENGYLVVA